MNATPFSCRALVMATWLISFAISSPLSAQNLVLNGSFEKTSYPGCHFNEPDSAFNAGMQDCQAFSTTIGLGLGGEICVMKGSACTYGLPAPSGSVKLGISAYGPTAMLQDQFSMTLSAPVIAGQAYALSFQAMGVITGFSPELSAVEVGISDDPGDFGSLVFSGTPGLTSWTGFSHEFLAPISGGYLTVRQRPGASVSWNQIDDFTLEESAGVNVCQTDLGSGGPGGIQLSICGETLATGNSATLDVSGAPASNFVYLVLGLTNSPTPFFGGTLVPVPALAIRAFPSDTTGTLQLLIPGGGGPVVGYLQAVTVDGALPGGYGLSNALEVNFLP